ncbi:hypothetical protein IWW36_005529, partial [Coemansia brasiliensis]
TYARASSQYSISSNEQLPWYPPFIAGAVAGLAQSAVVTPLDSLRVRFEVEDMVNGRYHSWWNFARGQISELGLHGLYRGLKLTLTKDVIGYAGFFGLFEWIKNETIDIYRDLVQVACSAKFFDSESQVSRLTSTRIAELRQLLNQEPERIASQGWIAKNSFVVLPVLFLPPVLGKPACVLFAGGIAALAYQAIDYPFERFRTLVYSKVASDEMVQHTIYRHFSGSSKNKPLAPAQTAAETTPYRVAWKLLVENISREYPHPVRSKVLQILLTARYLYRGWLGVSLRSIPAASVGLMVYELLKSSLVGEDSEGADIAPDAVSNEGAATVTCDNSHDDGIAPYENIVLTIPPVSSIVVDALYCHGQRLWKRQIDDVQFQLAQQDTMDGSTTNAVKQAIDSGSAATDVIKNQYEGGLKTWECAIDLLGYLISHRQYIFAAYDSPRVLELGCGTALPSLYLLSNLPNVKVCLQDYNRDVIELITLPN